MANIKNLITRSLKEKMARQDYANETARLRAIAEIDNTNAQTREVAPNAASNRNLQGAQARNYNVRSDWVPALAKSEIGLNAARGTNYNAESRVRNEQAGVLERARTPDPEYDAFIRDMYERLDMSQRRRAAPAADPVAPGMSATTITPVIRSAPIMAAPGIGQPVIVNPDIDRLIRGVPRFAEGTPMVYAGGETRVPGKGTGDKVPALLEPREAVLNVNAAEMLGRDNIETLNAVGNAMRNGVQKFAEGENNVQPAMASGASMQNPFGMDFGAYVQSVPSAPAEPALPAMAAAASPSFTMRPQAAARTVVPDATLEVTRRQQEVLGDRPIPRSWAPSSDPSVTEAQNLLRNAWNAGRFNNIVTPNNLGPDFNNFTTNRPIPGRSPGMPIVEEIISNAAFLQKPGSPLANPNVETPFKGTYEDTIREFGSPRPARQRQTARRRLADTMDGTEASPSRRVFLPGLQSGASDVGEASRQIAAGGLLGGLGLASEMFRTGRAPAPVVTKEMGVTPDMVKDAWQRRQSRSKQMQLPLGAVPVE